MYMPDLICSTHPHQMNQIHTMALAMRAQQSVTAAATLERQMFVAKQLQVRFGPVVLLQPTPVSLDLPLETYC